MFAHLDDPDPQPSPDRVRAAVLGRVRHRRRRRTAIAGGVAALAVGGAAVTTLGVRDRVTPEQVDVEGLADDPPAVGEPVTVLVVGVDSHGDPARDAAEQRTGARTDTIVVVRVDPAAGEVRTLVVPRDLEVDEAPGTRINALLGTGGPEALVAAVEGQVGIAVDHYVEVDFAGFRDGVDALGGIRVAAPAPLRAEATGLSLAAGCQVLDGDQALALARSRSDVEVLGADGAWRTDTSGDLGRQDRVGVLATALLRAVADVGPADVPALVAEGLSLLRVDAELDTRDLVDLGRTAAALRVVGLGLPVEEVDREGAALLRLGPGAADVAAALVDGGVASAPPSLGGRPAGDQTGIAAC